jgi:predicted alpha/beta-fold hydrolase
MSDGSTDGEDKGQTLELATPRGTQLHATLNVQSADQPVVVMAHGLLGHGHYLFFPALMAALRAEGLGTCTFDFTGNGKSSGEMKLSGYLSDVRL